MATGAQESAGRHPERAGALYAPTFIINGRRYEGAWDESSLAEAASLETKKVIVQMGEPNRDGTLYKVCLPRGDRVFCRDAMKEREASVEEPINLAKEPDFYNVAENRSQVFERDKYKCHYCQKQLTRFTATLDHSAAGVKG